MMSIIYGRDMNIEYESFYISGRKSGVLLRAFTESSLSTKLVFNIPDGPMVDLHQKTKFVGEIEHWTAFEFQDRLEDTVLDAQFDGDLCRINGITIPSLADAIPSYASHLLLLNLLCSGSDRLNFRQFSESSQPLISEAEFVCQGSEQISTPTGVLEASKVVLLVGQKLTNTFWSVDGVLVKSDWQGAESYPETDQRRLLQDLAPEVNAEVQAFVAQNTEEA